MNSSVFKTMQKLSLNITSILAIKNSWFEDYLKINHIQHKSISTKTELIKEIQNSDFDILVCNNCPYILPVSQIKKPHQKYINIHPSLLPNLRGKNPVNGAILFNQRHGVTCHLMDDGIDTGQIIAQIPIDNISDLKLPLINEITFLTMGKVFEKAYKNNFEPTNDYIYFSKHYNDTTILFDDTPETIVAKIKAFGAKGFYTKYINKNTSYNCKDARIISSNITKILFEQNQDNTILIKYENNILVKYKEQYIEIEFDSYPEKLISNDVFLEKL